MTTSPVVDAARVSALELLFEYEPPVIAANPEWRDLRMSVDEVVDGVPWTGVTDGHVLAVIRGRFTLPFRTDRRQDIGNVRAAFQGEPTLEGDVAQLRAFLGPLRRDRCPECFGYGEVALCPTCVGEGLIFQDPDDADLDDSAIGDDIACSACEGRGADGCSRCHGESSRVDLVRVDGIAFNATVLVRGLAAASAALGPCAVEKWSAPNCEPAGLVISGPDWRVVAMGMRPESGEPGRSWP